MKNRQKFDFGELSERRMRGVSRYLIACAKKALACSPIDFGVPMYGGLRTKEEQNELFRKKYSRCDGYSRKSYHQQKDENREGKALDLVPYIPKIGFSYQAQARFGVIGMLMLEAWEELQENREIPKDLYLHWGGLWSHRNPINLGWDLAHYEIRTYPQKEKV